MARAKQEKTVRNIGIRVANPPSRECDDPNCPYHGTLRIRGRIITGKVIKADASNVLVERGYLHYVPKYERYERRRSRIRAHKPPCMDVEVGDTVRIGECRPISKTKRFVVFDKA